MKFYQVAITGIVRVADEDPSPITWEWSLDNLADRVQENLEHVDVEFREMMLAPRIEDFPNGKVPADTIGRELIPYPHPGGCEWPDAGCSCHE